MLVSNVRQRPAGVSRDGSAWESVNNISGPSLRKNASGYGGTCERLKKNSAFFVTQ